MDYKGITWAMLRGAFDSIRGMITVVYLDKEMNDRYRNRHSPSRANTPIRRRESDNLTETLPPKALKKHEESKVLTRIIQCSTLNGGIFICSIVLFSYGILPILSYLFTFGNGKETFFSYLFQSILTFIFQAIWVSPLFIMSKIVNSLWFQDIADSAYRYSRGRPQSVRSISILIADSCFSIGVQILFLCQAELINYIPMIVHVPGLSHLCYILSFLHMCLLYSLYSFEYKWFNLGWELHKRLQLIEENWPYFIGFGSILGIITQLTNSWVVNGCLFSMFFPLFIVSANEAEPVTNVRCFKLPVFNAVVYIPNKILNFFVGRNQNKNRNVPISNLNQSRSVTPPSMEAQPASSYQPISQHYSHRMSPSVKVRQHRR